jgi:glycosyltransferase involved in cell wall biosynthesis
MHVLLIHQAFISLNQAGGTRHYELARYLAEKGRRVTVIASPVSYLTGKVEAAESVQEVGGRLTILRASTYSALHRSFVHRVFSFFSFMVSSFLAGLRVRQVDLVWGTSPPIFQGVTAWLLARLKRVPFLFEVRDLWPAFAIQVGVLRNPLLIRFSEWLECFLYRHADCVMVNSPGFIQHVSERGARRVELIPNGADLAMFDPQADGWEFRRENGLDGKFVALYAGAHGMSNDLGVAIQAAQQLQKCPNIAIVLLGDGKEKLALMAQAREMELDNVYFLPPIPKEKMGEALAAADVCIAILKPAPLYNTVFPNKVFDYMAAGRPVAMAMEGVIREVVENAGAGVAVPPGDAAALAEAIRLLMEDREKGREMGRRARQCVEKNYERGILAERLDLLLTEMMGKDH